MDSISQMTCSALNNVNTRPTVVFIDAVNQVRAAQPLCKGYVHSVQFDLSSKATPIPCSTTCLQRPCPFRAVWPLIFKGHAHPVQYDLSSKATFPLCSTTSLQRPRFLCAVQPLFKGHLLEVYTISFVKTAKKSKYLRDINGIYFHQISVQGRWPPKFVLKMQSGTISFPFSQRVFLETELCSRPRILLQKLLATEGNKIDFTFLVFSPIFWMQHLIRCNIFVHTLESDLSIVLHYI